ncbi:hypothetical protein D3C81_949390 [compost metagenome]
MMTMTPGTGVVVVTGMMVSATTGIGRGATIATIAVIAGRGGAATTGTAVVIMATMTDRDCAGGPRGLRHSTTGRYGAPWCFLASGMLNDR